MNENGKSFLTNNEVHALAEIKRRISALYPVQGYYLFGSKARGDAQDDSDVDLLLLTKKELDYAETLKITHQIFEVNLEYDTLFSYITLDETTWNSKRYSFMPIHANILRDGVTV